ncbi:MAG: PAS domain S-box protein [Planctomycetota bacterium]
MYDFFEISNEMLCVANREGYLIRVNSAWTRALGWSEAELTSLPFIDFVHPDDVDATIREAAKLHQGDGYEAIGFENRYRCRDGTYRWLSWHTRYVSDTSELVATARDVTDQKLAADALRLSELRFRTLAAHAPVSIFLCDMAGQNTFVNRRWCEMSGLTPEETAGYGWRAAIHPDDLSPKTTLFDEKMSIGQEYDNEYRVVHRSGAIRWVRTFAAPIFDAEGAATSVVGMTMDVSDQHRLLEELRRERELLSELLEVQERERRAVCNDIHDGLMQHVTAAIMELEATEAGPLSANAHFTLQRAIRELRRGLEDGRRVIRGIRPAELDGAEIGLALEQLVDQFQGSGIHVDWKLDPGFGRLPDALQTALYRVAQEALNNARRHSGTDVIRVELNRCADQLRLRIRDFGCGFNPQSPRVNGFGLKGMAERLRLVGGTLSIESAPDEGTTVTATVPYKIEGGVPSGPPEQVALAQQQVAPPTQAGLAERAEQSRGTSD